MSLGINRTGIHAAPKATQELMKAGKAADECLQILEGSGTTEECSRVIEQTFKNAPRKTKEAAVTIIYYRLRQKYPYIGGIIYLDAVRDDLLKRIAAKNNEKGQMEPGVRLVRYIDIYARAYRCVDSRYANRNIRECMALIKEAPLDHSLTAQLHVIRQIEAFMKNMVSAEMREVYIHPFISLLAYSLIGDSI